MESLLCLSCFRSRQWLNPFWTLLKFFTLLLIVYELWNNNKYLPPNAPEWPWWWQRWQPQEWWPPLPQSHPRHRRISGNHFDNDEPNKVLSLSHLVLLLLLDLIIHLLLCSLTVHDSTLQHRIILNHNFIWNKFKFIQWPAEKTSPWPTLLPLHYSRPPLAYSGPVPGLHTNQPTPSL